MNLIRTILKKSDDRGASAVEYGLLIAGIAALIVLAVFALGPIVDEIFDDMSTTTTTESTTISATCNP